MKAYPVEALREQIADKTFNKTVSSDSGVYTWWFDQEGLDLIMKVLPNIEVNRLQTKTIKNKTYYALYFGIAKSLRQRLRWHINQKHTASCVNSGYLSTLRQTLSALLGIPMLTAQECVNQFIDTHAYVTIEITETREDARNIEENMLSKEYFPLNLQDNETVDKSITQKISALRKHYRTLDPTSLESKTPCPLD